MEFIAAAVVMLAIIVPVFLALEVATPHPGITRLPSFATAEEAAEKYLEANPLKTREAFAANDNEERLAA